MDVDLELDLDLRNGRQVGLVEAVRQAVVTGRLRPGAPLPSSRSLAGELGWARSTVVGAYDQLAAEGLLVARRGAGTAVAAIAWPRPGPTPSAVPDPVPAGGSKLLADFRPGEPDRAAFPRAAWAAAVRRVLQCSDDDLLGYDDPAGRPELRSGLASYLGRTRAVVATPEQVVIVGGVSQGLAVVAAALGELGVTTIAVEDPGLPHHHRILADGGLRPVPLPVDEQGARVDLLTGTSAGAVLVTPAHQYPMGVPLAPARRLELLAWARATGGVVVEDDYDGELRYDRQPVAALQGLDPDRVIYAGTASKSLAAGLGLGWLVVPPHLVSGVVARRRWRSVVSTLEQAALADVIERGVLDAQVRRQRAGYRRRREQVVEVLATVAPQLVLTGVAAGLHVTALLPPGAPADTVVVEQGLAASVGLAPLSVHHAAPASARHGLVLGYGRPPAHAFPAALERLGAFLATVAGGR